MISFKDITVMTKKTKKLKFTHGIEIRTPSQTVYFLSLCVFFLLFYSIILPPLFHARGHTHCLPKYGDNMYLKLIKHQMMRRRYALFTRLKGTFLKLLYRMKTVRTMKVMIPLYKRRKKRKYQKRIRYLISTN